MFRILLLLSLLPFALHAKVELTVIIPSYNNEKHVEDNLKSLAQQDYKEWELIYINDCSSDKTGEVAEKMVRKFGIEDRSFMIHNPARFGAMANIYYAVQLVDPKRVVVLLDGDDLLKGKKVLSLIAKIYQSKRVWMSYGNYETLPKDAPGWHKDPCYAFPDEVIKNNSFRSYTWIAYPLRTFYAKLFQKIKEEDLKYQGKFFPVVSDTGMMFPMLEMASNGHIRYVDKTLYIYRVNTGNNDYHLRLPLMQEVSKHIRALRPYKPLKKLF